MPLNSSNFRIGILSANRSERISEKSKAPEHPVLFDEEMEEAVARPDSDDYRASESSL